jgi:glycoprotein endo-alpha-1,2-mannosidase
MRITIGFSAALVALLALCLPGLALAGPPVVSAFYYPWFGSPENGGYAHWAQNGHAPPVDIASSYYPAYGPYSSSNAAVIAAQLSEAVRGGIDELALSWWGRGSAEDKVLPDVLAGASQAGMQIAAHIEPYAGRSVESVVADASYLRSLGIQTLYVYQAFAGIAPSDWAAANDLLRADGITTFAQTALVGQAAAGHFTGIYTYDTVTYGPRVLARLCNEAHAKGLLCAPSVGPGYDARRAVGDPHVKPRRHGQAYDAMWHAALAAGADRITITSFNEWQEGTQIEPAIPIRLGEYRYISYDGAWGLHGAAAEYAYLDRTAFWANLFRKAAAKPKP